MSAVIVLLDSRRPKPAPTAKEIRERHLREAYAARRPTHPDKPDPPKGAA